MFFIFVYILTYSKLIKIGGVHLISFVSTIVGNM